MFSGQQIVDALKSVNITHVVWLPDSAIGVWEDALAGATSLTLVRVCREGEAWALAAGLHLGGQRPIVMIQSTGLFESGDALRNALFDMKLPLFALVGHRSALVPDSTDTARRFAEPILQAWGIEHVTIARPNELPRLAEHYRACEAADKPGVVLMAEGRM